MKLSMRYKLADGVAIRPERFGGLVYNYRNRRLYFLHSHELAEFVGGLRTDESLGHAIDAFVRRHGPAGPTADAIVTSLTALADLGLLVRVDSGDRDTAEAPAACAPTLH